MSLRFLGRRPAALLRAIAFSFVFAGPAQALDPLLPPSGNFDLTQWKLTLPSGAEVQPSELSHGFLAPGMV